MNGAGVSLWIVPEGEARRRLSALIETLARRFGGPVFDPHVTLLAGLAGPAEDVMTRVRTIRRAPLRLHFTGPEAGTRYFRCLYLRVEPSPSLTALHEAARKAFETKDEPPFFPHLSLLYRPPPAPAGVVEQVRDAAPDGFDARRLDVYSTEGGVESWHRVGSLPLG